MENERSTVDEMIDALQRDDQETTLRLLHTLKGTAATIGAFKLQKLAANAEKELKESAENIKELPFKSTLQQELITVIKQIQLLKDKQTNIPKLQNYSKRK